MRVHYSALFRNALRTSRMTNLPDSSPKWGRQILPNRWMRWGSFCCKMIVYDARLVIISLIPGPSTLSGMLRDPDGEESPLCLWDVYPIG